MTIWNAYPQNYRAAEVQQVVRAVCAGECAAIVGLSGSGKSNLVGFLANRVLLPAACPRFILVDCNRLVEPGLGAFYRLLLRALGSTVGMEATEKDALGTLEAALAEELGAGKGVCFLLDRFDALFGLEVFPAIANSLRALRDAFKYHLTLVIATRRPLPADNELAELFFGRTVWLGPLAQEDAMWSARRDAMRFSAVPGGGDDRVWSEATLKRLVALSGGYPALLRAACEAYADGAALDDAALQAHPAVLQRVAEFWSDRPDADALESSRLNEIAWLNRPAHRSSDAPVFDETQLTAKESRLLEYLRAHAGEVCEKDALVQAVWPEDVIYQQGIRDESLAQLVRRLRVKIEPNPGEPQHLHTVPGRGYLFKA